MSNILVILFAILDCKVWSIAQVAAWADGHIDSVDSCLETVREAMRESGVLLPENVGELMAGFILLRYDAGELPEAQARSLIVDIVDAYETSSVDAEAAGTLSLDSSVYLDIRRSAEQALEYMSSDRYLESDRKLIND